MSRAILKHDAPTISLSITVNLNADKTLLLLAGAIWLLFDVIRFGSGVIAQNLSGSTETFLDWCADCYCATKRLIKWSRLFCQPVL